LRRKKGGRKERIYTDIPTYGGHVYGHVTVDYTSHCNKRNRVIKGERDNILGII
jgi:hypothetical protein